MQKVLERLLPENIEEEEKTNFRILIYYMCFTIIACTILSIIEIFYPSGDKTPYIYIAGTVMGLVVLLKYTGANILIGNIFVGFWAVILFSLSFETGGIYSLDAVSMSLIPITSFALINYKAGIAWLLFYLGYIYYLWMVIDSPEMDELYRAQTLVFDKNYYVMGSLIFSIFTFSMFFIFFFQRQRLLARLKDNQVVLKKHVAQLDKQSILLKKTQADLKRNNKELEEFAYIASHDLKQPLRTVSSFTNLLESHLGRKDVLDGEASQMLKFITAGSSKMNLLITDLLAFARLKREEAITFESINLDTLLNSVLFDLKEQIDTSGVHIQLTGLPELQVIPVKINQLFQNLISNAIKFRRRDEVCKVQVYATEKAEHWLFSIKDNGIGIKPEHQEKIFQPFKKLHNAPEFEGSGIGLATCLHIVKLHNGKIWVDSNLGAGTTFYFTIAKDLTIVKKKERKERMVEIT